MSWRLLAIALMGIILAACGGEEPEMPQPNYDEEQSEGYSSDSVDSVDSIDSDDSIDGDDQNDDSTDTTTAPSPTVIEYAPGRFACCIIFEQAEPIAVKAGEADVELTPSGTGLYLADIDAASGSCSLTIIESVAASGLNSSWTPMPMPPAECPGVYTLPFEKSAESALGVKILINGDREMAFGGWLGALIYRYAGFKDDNSLAPGAYTLAVDLINATYTYYK